MSHQENVVNRRQMLKLSVAGAAGSLLWNNAAGLPVTANKNPAVVEQWDCFELRYHGPSSGNPFLDVTLTAKFFLEHRIVSVTGFYDGEGIYVIRFMPDAPGAWTYKTESSHKELSGHEGSLRVTPPKEKNHGPVQVANQYHFAYADGVPYFPFGTTCYSMGFMGDPYEGQTLAALETASFNKVRLCLLPKPQDKRPLPRMPFEKASVSASKTEAFDLTQPNPEYFRHFEQRILDLQKLGIEADVILFHPYDSWGFNKMKAEEDARYLRYAVARLSAYRNVWWSIANEYDLIRSKTSADWDNSFRIVQQSDPYRHLCSIHHSRVVYDHSKSWCTHASLQEYDFDKSEEKRAQWGKPIIYDEIQYEGNIARRWGNLAAEEMVRRFWLATVAGTYASHGETYITPPGEPVWSDGGLLRGTSAPRIRFLRELVEGLKIKGLNEFHGAYYLSAGVVNEIYLYYFDTHALAEYDFPLPEGIRFTAKLIDPFAMKMEHLPGVFTGKSRGAKFVDENAGENIAGGTNHLKLPGRPYMAVLFERTT